MEKAGKSDRGKHHRMATGKYRIWPGVTCITLVGATIFVLVYLAAYRAGIIPLPELLAALLSSDGKDTTISVQAGETNAALPPPVSEEVTHYEPASQEAAVLLETLTTPERYHQRFRIRRTTGEQVTDISCELYVEGERWLLRYGDTNRNLDDGGNQVTLYICDGENLYRNKPTPLVTAVGDFTPDTLLGLPTLDWLRTEGATPVVQAENKALALSLVREDGLVWQGRVALDTGLFMEMALLRDGENLLSMYTEMFDLTPRALTATGFWDFPSNPTDNPNENP